MTGVLPSSKNFAKGHYLFRNTPDKTILKEARSPEARKGVLLMSCLPAENDQTSLNCPEFSIPLQVKM